jgi:hypothetical protein
MNVINCFITVYETLKKVNYSTLTKTLVFRNITGLMGIWILLGIVRLNRSLLPLKAKITTLSKLEWCRYLQSYLKAISISLEHFLSEYFSPL